MMKPYKREAFRIDTRSSVEDQANSNIQCATCEAPIEYEGAKHCAHCRMYWDDCDNDLFADDGYENYLRDLQDDEDRDLMEHDSYSHNPFPYEELYGDCY